MFLGPSPKQHQESTKITLQFVFPRWCSPVAEKSLLYNISPVSFSKASQSASDPKTAPSPLATAGCEHTHTQRQNPRGLGLLSSLHQREALVEVQLSEIKTQRLLSSPLGGLICFPATRPAPRWGKALSTSGALVFITTSS